MVDWMVEVLTNFRCTNSCFFVAVGLIDQYFKTVPTKLLIKDLHCIGVVCMFIASKYEDIYPLKLSVVHEKIAHRKLSVEQMRDKESEILQTLDFDIRHPTLYDFLTIYQEHALRPNLTLIQLTDSYELIDLLSIYVAKMVYHDYDLSQLSPSLLAASSLYVALKLTEKFKKSSGIINERFIVKLCEMSQKSETEII